MKERGKGGRERERRRGWEAGEGEGWEGEIGMMRGRKENNRDGDMIEGHNGPMDFGHSRWQ